MDQPWSLDLVLPPLGALILAPERSWPVAS
jgi:hypothetical protein